MHGISPILKISKIIHPRCYANNKISNANNISLSKNQLCKLEEQINKTSTFVN